jgi:hypothetical protein
MRIPQSIKVILKRKHASIQIDENTLIHDIQPMWDPEWGYFVYFSLYLKFGEYEINIRRCKFYLKNEGLAWKTPSNSSIVELNITLYQGVLTALLAQKWVDIIGRQKAGRRAAPIEMSDFESIFGASPTVSSN